MCVLYKTLRSTFDVELIKITRKVISVKESITSRFKWIREEQRVKRGAISSDLTTKSGEHNKKWLECCWIKINSTNKTKRGSIN